MVVVKILCFKAVVPKPRQHMLTQIEASSPSLSILVRTPDEAQLPTIVSLPCEHFSIAQDALPRLPGGTIARTNGITLSSSAR